MSDRLTNGSLVIALMDDYDLISKPGSRAIITLDDDDQEFLDEWAPDFYVEEEQCYIYPSYSDVVRNGTSQAMS